MDLAPYLFGSHAFFFRDGDPFTLPAPGTCGRDSKPGAADTAWIGMGVIEEASDNLEDELIPVWRPSPGRLRYYDELSNKDKLVVKFTTSELGPLAMEVLYRTLPLTAASTQFNPLEGKLKKGWLKIQRYDQDDVLRIVMDLYVRLKVSGDLAMGGDLVKVQWEAAVLHSTLNTASLS